MKILNLKYKMHKIVNYVFYLIIFIFGFLLGFSAEKIDFSKLISEVLFIDSVNAYTVNKCHISKNLWNSTDPLTVVTSKHIDISLNPGTYTISVDSITTTSPSTTFHISFLDSDGNTDLVIYLPLSSKEITFTLTEPSTEVDFWSGDYWDRSRNYTTTFNNIMLVNGSKALPYEKYGVEICEEIYYDLDDFYSFSKNIFGEVDEENKFIYDFITFGLVATCFILMILVIGYIIKKFLGG